MNSHEFIAIPAVDQQSVLNLEPTEAPPAELQVLPSQRRAFALPGGASLWWWLSREVTDEDMAFVPSGKFQASKSSGQGYSG